MTFKAYSWVHKEKNIKYKTVGIKRIRYFVSNIVKNHAFIENTVCGLKFECFKAVYQNGLICFNGDAISEMYFHYFIYM